MITIRPSEERGHASYGWLDTYHTFSFNTYYDPEHMGFRSLRVINDDIVAPGAGFPTHPHRDMEIITYVLDGSLAHKDSTGGEGAITGTPSGNDVQHMTAGRGVLHSEFNASSTENVRLLQIWILPRERNLEPGYQQKFFPNAEKQGRLRLIVSGDGRGGSLKIEQDAEMYAAILGSGQTVRHELKPGRGAWLQVAKGSVELNGKTLKQGDGAAIASEPELAITGAAGPAEILLFDLK
jgi:redox-sensitive bicupin YhaK (pirin superfamily)